MLSTGVKRIATGLGRKRMRQQTALQRIAGHHQPLHYVEIAARLNIIPFRRAI